MIEEDEEFHASLVQGVEVIQGVIATKEFTDINKIDSMLMTREVII